MLRSDKGVYKASGSPTNVQDWVDQSRVAYTFEQANYENKYGTNLGFESALGAEWVEFISGAATGTTTRDTTVSCYGSASLKLDMTAASGAADVRRRQADIAAVAGEVWSVGAMCKVLSITGAARARLQIEFRDAALAVIGSATIVDFSTIGAWSLVSSLNLTAPALTAWIRINLMVRGDAAGAIAACYWDGAQIVKSASLPNIYSQGQSIKNSFDQRTTSQQPTLTPAVFFGKPGVKFDGSDDILKAIMGAYLTGSSGLVLALLQLTGTTSQTQVIIGSFDEADVTRFVSARIRRTDANPYANMIQREADTNDIVQGGTTISAARYLAVFRSDGSAYTIRLNQREEVLTVAAGANTGDWFSDVTLKDNVTIGGHKQSSEGSYLQAYIALLLVYEGDPGIGSRMRQLERLLRQRGLRALR